MNHGNTPPSWVVLKFGGTSVASQARWNNIASLAKAKREAGHRVLIVVSAISGITNALQSVIDLATRQEDLEAAVLAIHNRHVDFVKELGLEDASTLDQWLRRLNELAQDARRLTPEFSWQAEILALGELMSSAIGAHYLRKLGLDADWLDARQCLVAEPQANQSPWASWLCVNCSLDDGSAVSASLAPRAPILITQGFIARNRDGDTVILGRGGSDTSASYFGALLQAQCVEIWTDVAGMFSANPRQVPKACLLKRLDYEEAQEIATTGAKVLHPRSLNPVREKKVPLCIKDTNRPELEGTIIEAQPASLLPSVKAISARTGITLISMETIGMWQQVGFLADVFAEFKKHGLSIDLISSAETNVTVSLDPSENLVSTSVLSALCADLERFCKVKVIAPCAAVTLVGRGIRSLLHRLSPIFAEFGQLSVHLISQSSNNLNLTFVIDELIAWSLIPKLHDMLVESEAMRLEDDAVFGASWENLYKTAMQKPQRNPWWRAKKTALLALAQEQGPCFAYDLSQIGRNITQLRGIAAVDRWFYAMKANAHARVLQTVVDSGVAIECVSLAEIEAIRRAKPDLDHGSILFTPNFAPKCEYAKAFEQNAIVTVDALYPLQAWPEIFKGRSFILRLDLGYGRGHHDKVVTGGSNSKFGLPLADCAEFMGLAKALEAKIVGLHGHLGSGVLDTNHFENTYRVMAKVAAQFPDCRSLNIGGGLGVPYRPDESALDLGELAQKLAAIKAEYAQYQLWMEPGRYVVAEAGVLLARVTQTKGKDAYTYLGIDTGMNSLIRPALYDAWHPIHNLTRLDEPATCHYQIVGPICESSDILGTNRHMPEAHEGDVVLIDLAGAYGAVMSSRYNLREPAKEVVV